MELKLTYLIRSSFMWIARRERERRAQQRKCCHSREAMRDCTTFTLFDFSELLDIIWNIWLHAVIGRWITFSWNSL